MKDGVYFVEDRRLKITELIERQGKATVDQLCQVFDVSKSTIRNDLMELDKLGLLQRTHGGAIKSSEIRQVGLEPKPEQKRQSQLAEKLAIAKLASDFVSDGDTIAITTGTTTFEFAKQLNKKKNLTIITNDILIVQWLEKFSPHSVYVIGGMIRKNFHYMIFEYDQISNIYVDKIFFSCNSYCYTNGATVPDYQLAHNVRTILKKSNERYLLCDSTKIGNTSFAKIADVQDLTALIVDDKISSSSLEKIKKANHHEVFVTKK